MGERLSFRRYPGLFGLAAVAVLVGSTLPGMQAPAASASASTALSRGSAARGLARAVADARTGGARVKAIENILKALHVDVIDPRTGAEIVPGSARTLYDGYLYTNEVAELAAAYHAGRRVSLAEVAGALNRAAYAMLRHRMTAASLERVLLTVTRRDTSSAVPDSVALLQRVVWQLGLLHKVPQNLAGPVKPAKVSLDPVQEWLVIADFTFPLLYDAKPLTKPASALVRGSDGVIKRTPASPAGICDFLKPLKPFLNKLGSYALQELAEEFPKFGKVAPFLGPLTDLVHGSVLGVGIVVTLWAKPDSTHLGGSDLYFFGQVWMVLHLPPWLAKCGWLTGDDFPGFGGVEGVRAYWETDQLDKWGTSHCLTIGGLPPACQTEAHGVAVEEFTPNPDPVANGIPKEESGTVSFVPLADVSLGNKLGILADYARLEAVPFKIWHRKPHGPPTAFKATLTFHDPKIGGVQGSAASKGPITLPKQKLKQVTGTKGLYYDSGSSGPPLSGSMTWSEPIPCISSGPVNDSASSFDLQIDPTSTELSTISVRVTATYPSSSTCYAPVVNLRWPVGGFGDGSSPIWKPEDITSTVPLWDVGLNKKIGSITFSWIYGRK